MNRLFSYCIPVDDGVAPNPFGGICTLAICKPKIRRVAKKGDWVVGTGSRNVTINGITTNFAGRMVYAMQITDIKTMKEYDAYTKRHLPVKVATPFKDRSRPTCVGDSIYDFTDLDAYGKPMMRRHSAHWGTDWEEYRETDLNGLNVLLSDHFYYFGDKAIPLPTVLRPIAQNQQGHRSNANQHLLKEFERWIQSLGRKRNTVYGKPQLWAGGQIPKSPFRIRCGRGIPPRPRRC